MIDVSLYQRGPGGSSEPALTPLAAFSFSLVATISTTMIGLCAILGFTAKASRKPHNRKQPGDVARRVAQSAGAMLAV